MKIVRKDLICLKKALSAEEPDKSMIEELLLNIFGKY